MVCSDMISIARFLQEQRSAHQPYRIYFAYRNMPHMSIVLLMFSIFICMVEKEYICFSCPFLYWT